MKILLVDDDDLSRRVVRKVLEGLLGHEVIEASNAEEGFSTFQSGHFPLVMTDVKMPGKSGLDLLRDIKNSPVGQNTAVVLITGHADVDSAVQALREGAVDFLRKPLQASDLVDVINRVLLSITVPQPEKGHQSPSREKNRRGEIAELETPDSIVVLPDASSIGLYTPAMQALSNVALRFHEDRAVPVLIEGETGTGKEMFARLIHYGLDRETKAPFVPVNCAAFSPSLFESELFGYVGGAFTGALRSGAAGKLESAKGGTIFLDEVGEIPLGLQAKLLRALTDHAIYRVGGNNLIPLDVRVIAATNRNLAAMVHEGEFRQDLYYRLNVGRLQVPPLRKQQTSIRPLAEQFLVRFAEQKNRKFKTITAQAGKVLEDHPWPGNIRELQNVIEHAVLLYNDEELQPEHITMLNAPGPQFHTTEVSFSPGNIQLPDQPFKLDELNREIVEKALDKFDGNKSKTADFLGLTRSALRSRLG